MSDMETEMLDRAPLVSSATPSEFAPSRSGSVEAERAPDPSTAPMPNPKEKAAKKAGSKKRKAEKDAPTASSFTNTSTADPATASSSRKKRKSNTKPAKALALGRSYDECSDWDKKLIDMKESGEDWAAIREMWRQETGEDPCGSTLPNRYIRLKSLFTIINEEDNAILIKCKQEVESQMEREKWSRVADLMQDEGTDAYEPETLKLQYAKLFKQFEHAALIEHAREQAVARVEAMQARKRDEVERIVRETVNGLMASVNNQEIELGGPVEA